MLKHLFCIILLTTTHTAGANEGKDHQIVQIEVTEKGFVPNMIDVKPGTAVTLEVTRTTESTCAKEIQVPAKKIKKNLPLNKKVTLALGKLSAGEIRFGCGMDMMDSGKIIAH